MYSKRYAYTDQKWTYEYPYLTEEIIRKEVCEKRDYDDKKPGIEEQIERLAEFVAKIADRANIDLSEIIHGIEEVKQ